jgi:hypothetical protein
MNYDLVVLITFHENKECLLDLILNIKKFNKENVAIIISNGSTENLDDIKTQNSVFIVDRKQQMVEKFGTIIPLHLELFDFIKESEITATHILLLASNQLFVRHGFYKFMKKFDFGYYEREIPKQNYLSFWEGSPMFQKFIEKIGAEFFTLQSNHDGMFFRFDIFKDMMEYFESYRNTCSLHHHEEFMYISYLNKFHDKSKSVEFNTYNCFNMVELDEERVRNAINSNQFIVKRIPRDINNPTRIYIKNLS